MAADTLLRASSERTHAARPSPASAETATTAADAALTDAERHLSGALMRVNHVGEVCAQALYSAQALTTDSPALRRQFEAAAGEEIDHLAWTRERLTELDSRPSLLNPLWFAGSFGIGLLAGRAGDAISLGFMAETELQVEEHLAGHLAKLPQNDRRSRVILRQMKDDEAGHAAAARHAGAADLPLPVRWAMRAAAKVMTTTAFRL